MFKIGIGRAHARTRVICLAKDPDIGITDTDRTYQPTGLPEGGPRDPRKPKHPNP
jgi:hypothetical protein